MPYYSGPATAADFGVPELRRNLAKKKKELDQVTRLLCSLCKEVESSSLKSFIATVEKGELKDWWENHKKLDARREAREAKEKKARNEQKKRKEETETLKAKALSKLTEHEKKALGVKK